MISSAPQKRKQDDGATPVNSSLFFHQRKAIERKAEEIGADIICEFVIPQPSYAATSSQFQNMLHYISDHGVNYVVIYPDRPHCIHKKSDLIETAIIAAGAQLVSVRDVDSLPELLRISARAPRLGHRRAPRRAA
jgi:hypothetical protein